MRRTIIAVAVAGLLLFGCTSGESSSSDTTAGDTTDSTTAATFASGPAPGVTDDSVKVGVAYVDLASLAGIVDIDHGDYEAAYNALFDAINADGGINGRTIEPVFAPIAPTGTEPADAACTKLTEDDDVFLIMGFFLGDNVLCPVETHSTAVIGGVQTAERVARADAPWYSNEGSEDLQAEAVRSMAEAGELDGTVAVFGGPEEQTLMNDVILPLLDDEGIDVAENAIVDQTAEDIAATNNNTETIAQRFEASGVDQVILLGTSSLAWAQGVGPLDYRPALRFTEQGAINTYVGQESADLTLLDGAVLGGLYGGAANQYQLPAMQDCLGTIEDAGIEVPDPTGQETSDLQPWTSSMTACQQVVLFQALVEAAGDDLNYGSLQGGAEGLVVDMPNQPEPLTFGNGEHGDGDPPAYLFDFDADARAFVLREGQAGGGDSGASDTTDTTAD